MRLYAAYKRQIGVPADRPLPRYIIVSWVVLVVIAGGWVAAIVALVR